MRVFRVLSTTAILLIVPQSLVAAPFAVPVGKSVGLTCASADSMTMQYNGGWSGGGNVVRVGFRPAKQPASGGVPAGECAWSDRAMRADEPAMLCQDANVGKLTVWTYNNHASSVTVAGAPYIPAILTNAGGKFTFMVHKGDGGCLVIDQISPDKQKLF